MASETLESSLPPIVHNERKPMPRWKKRLIGYGLGLLAVASGSAYVVKRENLIRENNTNNEIEGLFRGYGADHYGVMIDVSRNGHHMDIGCENLNAKLDTKVENPHLSFNLRKKVGGDSVAYEAYVKNQGAILDADGGVMVPPHDVVIPLGSQAQFETFMESGDRDVYCLTKYPKP